jgi:ATP-binding cassette subfamily B protein
MDKEKQPSAFSRLMGYAGNHAKLTYLSLALSVCSAVIGLMPFVCLWKIIKEIIEVSPDFSKAENIIRNGWLAVLFAVVSWLIYIIGLMCSHKAAFRVAGNMKKTILSHIAKLPIGFADDIGSGKVRRIVTDTSDASETLLAHNLPDMAAAIATPLTMIVLLFVYDWKFGLACLIPIILSFMCMFRMAGPSMAEDMRQYQNALENMSNEATEYIRGVPVVKTFGQTVFSFQRFKKSIDDYSKFCIHYTKTCRRPMLMFTVLINSAFAFIIALSLLLVHRSGYQQDILMNFLFYVIFTPVVQTAMNKVMYISENSMKINDAMIRFDSIMNIQPLAETAHGKSANSSSVALENVTFRYREDAEPAVKGLNITADKNQIVALVGPSGSGKTTVAGLISRFFDPQEGTVKLGGVDVREIPKKKLMNSISYVFQDSRLLKRSIADNLRIAKPDASENELIDVLRKAQCMDIIERLPDGINAVLGSKGTYLSGGEQQRIAIARAMLKNADVVILDEASAFADPECEAEVQKAFDEMAKGRTVIMIAHRLSTVINADKIYVLNNGTVEESGRHEELLAKGGLYSKMWNEYQSSINWKVGEVV